jgi:hypothetical protein
MPQSQGAGRRQAGTCYCDCRSRRLGSSRSENGTERPEYRAHSGGTRDRIALRMERHRPLQLHIQKILGSMEIPSCEERHTRTPLGIRRRTIKKLSREFSLGAKWTTCWHGGPSGGHLRLNKTLNKVRQKYYWFQARNHVEKWSRQWDTCAVGRGSRTRNRGQCRGTIRKDNHRCRRAIPTKRPRKLIPPDRYGLFYEVAGILSHSQSKGFDSSGSAGYQLLPSLQSTTGAT